MLHAAFKTQPAFLDQPFSPPFHPSLHGFDAALNDQFPRWFANSALLTAASVAATLAIASLAAWGFSRWSFRGRDALLSLLVSLMVVPPVVLLVPLFVFGAKLGWISTFRLVILIALVFLQDDTKKTLMVGITGFQSRFNLDVPAIMSGLTLATLPVVTLYVFGQRFFVRGLVSGAVKGE